MKKQVLFLFIAVIKEDVFITTPEPPTSTPPAQGRTHLIVKGENVPIAACPPSRQIMQPQSHVTDIHKAGHFKIPEASTDLQSITTSERENTPTTASATPTVSLSAPGTSKCQHTQQGPHWKYRFMCSLHAFEALTG